jgi:hypothetical protein
VPDFQNFFALAQVDHINIELHAESMDALCRDNPQSFTLEQPLML